MVSAMERSAQYRVLKKSGGVCDVVSSNQPYNGAYTTLNEIARNMIVTGKFKPFLSGEGYIKLQSPKGEIVELSLQAVWL